MTLRINHADGFRNVGTVIIENGVVKETKECCGQRNLLAMRGWAEASVREYCKTRNWIISVVDSPPAQAQVKT